MTAAAWHRAAIGADGASSLEDIFGHLETPALSAWSVCLSLEGCGRWIGGSGC